MKLYGHPVSTCTRKVLTTLAELELPFEMIVIDFASQEHKQPPHLARQPFGQIPVLDDDGFEMFESRAISRYLNEKHDGPLIPRDLQSRARMEQWMSVEQSDFSGPAMKFVFQHVFQRKQDDAVLETAGNSLDTALRAMDARLREVPFFAGDAFSLADVCYLPYVEYLMSTPVKDTIDKHEHVAAWWSKVSDRPSWRKVSGRAA